MESLLSKVFDIVGELSAQLSICLGVGSFSSLQVSEDEEVNRQRRKHREETKIQTEIKKWGGRKREIQGC